MILAPALLKQLAQAQMVLPSVMLVYGEEPLYIRRVTDSLRQALVQQGFDQRDRFDIDAQFDWQGLLMETQSGSLFAQKRIIELSMPTGNPGKEGGAFIQAWCNQPAQPEMDLVLIIYCERLDARQTKSKWVQSIESAGLVVQSKPIEPRELPKWCQHQAQNLSLQLDYDAACLLAERVEGNLLAADQELEKLALIKPAGSQVNLQDIEQKVVDQAHYQLFALSSLLLLGKVKDGLHVLQRLKQEGTEAPIVLWLLTKELRLLSELVQKQQQMPLPQVMKNLRIWSSKQQEYTQALRRQNARHWQDCLLQAYQIDRQIKGLQTGDPWLGLADLLVNMAH
ncbi:DNA polymerase III subunit delta [Thiomicrospira microaerophila]|uniref:DNA polymerase III subunit delta n=1 Tax=Thiomicrospira microaerophila TaxID=406020 RepID=UPI0005C9FA6D|nr:DNA polymerase III subunit delta [Thiomicrospira microaerophila]